MPMEMTYADDVDFFEEEEEPLDQLQPIAAETLKSPYNLFMNNTKTDFTNVFLADVTEADDELEPLRGREPWRKKKVLGSLLCSTEDIKSRRIMGNLAFKSYWKIWNRRSKIPLQTRLHLYNAICVSVMLYNCSSWAVPKAQLDKLDACHRNHLRIITGHKWPNSLISNDALYRMCKDEPLSRRVHRARWNMFGHVLRMDMNSPAQKSLEFALAGSTKYRARSGRHCSNLLEQLRADMKLRQRGQLRTIRQLSFLRQQAHDKHTWRLF